MAILLPPLPAVPLVSVVTPSFNMAGFIAQTIESVLSQDYPRIEYIVVDGGSSDGTREILSGYGARLRYRSEPDGGAADAVNRGIRMSSGEVCAWIGADDTYAPGAVAAAVARLKNDPSAGVVYGRAYWIDAAGDVIRPYPASPSAVDSLRRECLVCQPAAFMRRDAFERAGGLDASLQSAFDYDLWIRMSRGAKFAFLDRYLANSRMHARNKTLGQRKLAFREAMLLQKKHFGYVPFQTIYSYSAYTLDRRDQFEAPVRRSLPAYLLSLPVGLAANRGAFAAYAAEWASAMSFKGLARALGGRR